MQITTHQLAKCEWNSGLASKNKNPLANLGSVFFRLTDSSSPYPELFSDLATENSELITCHSGECLEKLVHTHAINFFSLPKNLFSILLTQVSDLGVTYE
jgi:hypothetical protein